MSDIILFHFEQNEIRYVGDGINHEWVAQDVCDVLGIKNARDAINEFSENQKGVAIIYTLGGEQEVNTVTEPGLYRLVFKSRKPVAERFQNWVTDEVIPSIRKTGSYSLEQDKSKLERQFLPTPSQKELKEGHGLYRLMYGKAYADRWLQHKVKEFYPALAPHELPTKEELPSLPTRALLTPTELGVELGLLYSTGTGNARAVNKLLEGLGYQVKVSGQWSATDKAHNLCDRKPVDTNSRTQKDQLLWSLEIVPVLKEHVTV